MTPPADPRRQLRLRTLKRDFDTVSTQLLALTEAALAGGVTQLPVFIATKAPVGLGLPALSAERLGLAWNFRISLVEELLRKKILTAENLDRFKETFGDPLDRACILVVEGEEAEFAFLPYEAPETL